MAEQWEKSEVEQAEDRLAEAAVYRGIMGRKRLADLLRDGVSVREVVPRLLHILAHPYKDRVAEQAEKLRASGAERRALSRKANQTPDVVILEDVSLAEVQHMLHLRAEGVSPSRIAAMFDLPGKTLRDIFATMDGKMEHTVLFSAEQRRRRRETLGRPKVRIVRTDAEVTGETESVPLYAVEEEAETRTVEVRL